MCEFQAMDTRKMIGVAKEQNELYYLTKESHYPTAGQLRVARSSQSTSDLANIWLHHYRLGHPPFALLKTMFPTLFRTLDPSTFQCDVCNFQASSSVLSN